MLHSSVDAFSSERKVIHGVNRAEVLIRVLGRSMVGRPGALLLRGWHPGCLRSVSKSALHQELGWRGGDRAIPASLPLILAESKQQAFPVTAAGSILASAVAPRLHGGAELGKTPSSSGNRSSNRLRCSLGTASLFEADVYFRGVSALSACVRAACIVSRYHVVIVRMLVDVLIVKRS